MARDTASQTQANEVDLRWLISVPLAGWRWVAASTLLFGLIALLFSLAVPPSYRAAAVVTSRQESSTYQFNPFLPASASRDAQRPNFESLVGYAKSGEVLEAMLASLEAENKLHFESAAELSRVLSYELDSGGELARLYATSGSSNGAAALANLWAAEFANYLNLRYASKSEDVVFFTEQSALALLELQAADEALNDFDAQDFSEVYKADLGVLLGRYQTLLTRRSTLVDTQVRSVLLRQQLEDLPSETPARLVDEIAILGLQSASYESGVIGSSLVQLDGRSVVSGATSGEQVRYLLGLEAGLGELAASVERQLEPLPGEIRRLQEQIQAASMDRQRLQDAQIVSNDTYLAIERKLAEVELLASTNSSLASVMRLAFPPNEVLSPRPLTNTMLAAVLGLMVGIALSFALDYARRQRSRPA